MIIARAAIMSQGGNIFTPNDTHYPSSSPLQHYGHADQSSQTGSGYSSPAFENDVTPENAIVHYDGQIGFDTYHNNQDISHATWVAPISGNLTPPPMKYEDDVSSYHEIPLSYKRTSDTSLLTPRSSFSDNANGLKRSSSSTRSKSPAILKPDTSQTRVTKTASRSKKSKTGKSNVEAPEVPAPLSILTEHMTDVPIKDMEVWVDRSIEDRHAEREKNNGHISRPMNSFVMYRSAYAERAKEWCARNNHQVISKVAGDSWRQETKEVKDKYRELGTREQENHTKAFPKYKFQPKKSVIPARRKSESTEDDDEDFDGSDPDDWEYKPRNERQSRAQVVQRRYVDPEFQHSSPLPSQTGDDVHFGLNMDYNKTSWEAMNAGRTFPNGFGLHEYPHQYLQTVYPGVCTPGVEEVRVRTFGSPGGFGYGNFLSGVPGSQNPELLHSQTHTPVPVGNHMEPILETCFEDGGYGNFSASNSHPFAGSCMIAGDSYFQVPPTSQFDAWMEQH